MLACVPVEGGHCSVVQAYALVARELGEIHDRLAPGTVICLDCRRVGRSLRDRVFLAHLRQQGHVCFAQVTGISVLIYCAHCGESSYCTSSSSARGNPDLARENTYESNTVGYENDAMHSNDTMVSTHRGVCNLGSTCFLSAALQVLFASPHVLRVLTSLHSLCSIQPISSRTALPTDPPLSCVACELSCLLTQDTQAPLVPSDLLFAVWSKCSSLARYEQQDAQEFLLALVHCYDEAAAANHSASPGHETHSHETHSHETHSHETQSGGIHSDATLRRVFQGELESSLLCSACRHRSVKREEFADVSLSLTDSPSLLSLLTLFTATETLAEPLECVECKQRAVAHKRLLFASLPPTLILHVKRFDVSFKHKIRDHVSFPLHSLRLTGCLSEDAIDNEYHLVAVVSHSGADLRQGHYIAYVRQSGVNGVSGVSGVGWLRCDDDEVIACAEEEVASAEAYLLVYSVSC